MKKIISIAGAAILFCGSAFADSFTWTIAPNTTSNILAAPIKLLSLSITATNQVTLNIWDSPNNKFTNNIPAYTNYTQYATNVSQIYTNFFGVATTNWLTNALVMQTNSVAAQTLNYPQVFSQTVLSNNTANLLGLNITFVNGVLVSNASPNTITFTASFSGN